MPNIKAMERRLRALEIKFKAASAANAKLSFIIIESIIEHFPEQIPLIKYLVEFECISAADLEKIDGSDYPDYGYNSQYLEQIQYIRELFYDTLDEHGIFYDENETENLLKEFRKNNRGDYPSPRHVKIDNDSQ